MMFDPKMLEQLGQFAPPGMVRACQVMAEIIPNLAEQVQKGTLTPLDASAKAGAAMLPVFKEIQSASREAPQTR